MDALRSYFYPPLCVCFVLLTLHTSLGNAFIKCKENERQALLSLKQGFLDYYGNLSSWGNAEHQADCCKWDGVSCSNRTGHVVKLDLKSYELGGTIYPSLSELRHLNYLDLSFNFFYNLTEFPICIASLTHLKFLDLSRAYVQGNIPDQLGGLSRLVHLNLANNRLFGRIPPQLGNLSSLQFLDLRENFFVGMVPPTLQNLSMLKSIGLGYSPFYNSSLTSDLNWVSPLASLNTLRLVNLNLSDAKNWLKHVSNLTHLQELVISSCGLIDSEPWPSLSNNINSSSLTTIYLPLNSLTSFKTLLPWLLSHKDSIVQLGLPYNNLKGPIPKVFGNFSSLEELNLQGNQLEGEIPQSLLERCTLRFLTLGLNSLSGKLEDIIQGFSGCANKSLEALSLSSNQIVGSVPDLSQFSFLEILQISENRLNGTISMGIGQLSNLEVLTLDSNSLHGVITESHFLRLSKLNTLDLSYNALVFNVGQNWVPPFQLDIILLASCKLGPTFPTWLQAQKKYFMLDLSNNQISGTLPDLQLQLFDHDLSGIDLSDNLLEGAAPSYLAVKVSVLHLSNNKFTDANLLLCPNMATKLVVLDISNNQFSGALPDCWSNFGSLLFLNVSYNSFSGKIPISLGFLRQVQSLHLSNNRFMGEIPLSLSNCKELRIFDVAQNNLVGLIPNWMGDELNKLLVLSLRSNQFSGVLPYTICHLFHVQILDLSLNNISGRMPKCLNNLTALAAQTSSDALIKYYLYEIRAYAFILDSASLIWKGKESKYSSTLGLLRSIDLSSNMLIGEIPSELMDLVGLVSLNISRNMFSGEIPGTIGQLKSLDFLDLSRNRLSGKIPSELSQIDRLGVMDLSYNNLSGEIPRGTQLQSFNASTYMGNEELCGDPLPKCPTEQTGDDGDSEHDEKFFDGGFFISLSAGFSIGFWGVCSLIFFKQSWRYAYFKFLNDAYDKLYVMVAINMAKFRRWKRGSTLTQRTLKLIKRSLLKHMWLEASVSTIQEVLNMKVSTISLAIEFLTPRLYHRIYWLPFLEVSIIRRLLHGSINEAEFVFCLQRILDCQAPRYKIIPSERSDNQGHACLIRVI
ncbi:receptor-like protein 12 [Senna tora]|uniref:Receptor-like protein 12 n=1 Tax=Senna tora TaxID=362788 RepID=A0A834SYK6_9FABA|nr:receptor-like protein 12 [Senna tora]